MKGNVKLFLVRRDLGKKTEYYMTEADCEAEAIRKVMRFCYAIERGKDGLTVIEFIRSKRDQFRIVKSDMIIKVQSATCPKCGSILIFKRGEKQ